MITPRKSPASRRLRSADHKLLLVVLGGRVDSFSDFGTVGTWRLAASYVFAATGTTLRSSYATGLRRPASRTRSSASNVNDVLYPERSRGFDVGFEQSLCKRQLTFGANFFYNRLTNLVGFDNDFNTFNLGRARTQGVEAFARWEPVKNLDFHRVVHLSRRAPDRQRRHQPAGRRRACRGARAINSLQPSATNVSVTG